MEKWMLRGVWEGRGGEGGKEDYEKRRREKGRKKENWWRKKESWEWLINFKYIYFFPSLRSYSTKSNLVLMDQRINNYSSLIWTRGLKTAINRKKLQIFNVSRWSIKTSIETIYIYFTTAFPLPRRLPLGRMLYANPDANVHQKISGIAIYFQVFHRLSLISHL